MVPMIYKHTKLYSKHFFLMLSFMLSVCRYIQKISYMFTQFLKNMKIAIASFLFKKEVLKSTYFPFFSKWGDRHHDYSGLMCQAHF